MKPITLLLLLSVIALSASGQRGSRLNHVPFTIDTFRYKGESVAIQRYKDADLNEAFGNDANLNLAITAIEKLQHLFGGMKKYVSQGQRINSIKVAEDYLNEISSEQPGFDITNYRAECNFYNKFSAGTPSAAVAATANAPSIYDEILSKEDPNVITEYDRAMAKRYNIVDGAGINTPVGQAWSKIQGINARKRQREIDSERADLMERNQQSIREGEAIRLKELTKKYGAATARKLMDKKTWIGMTAAMVIDEFGEAMDVTTTRTAKGEEVTYYYLTYNPATISDLRYDLAVTFRNSIVVAIHEN